MVTVVAALVETAIVYLTNADFAIMEMTIRNAGIGLIVAGHNWFKHYMRPKVATYMSR
jgi:hypothetical protein